MHSSGAVARLPAVQHKRESDGTDVWTSRRGELRIRAPVKGLLIVRFSGDFTDEFAATCTEVTLRATADVEKYTVFHDWEGMETYETASRVRLTSLAQLHKHKLEAVHLLVRSPAVAIGVQVANLVVKILTPYTDRALFEASLSRVLVAKGAALPRS